MSRVPMKLFVSAVGSLALMVAAGCEERTTTTPSGDPAVAPSSPNQDVNALRPTPSSSAIGAGGASTVSDSERLPVSGTEADPMGGGKGGHAGHAGHGGSH